jgi:hypothetical protein
VLKSPQLIIVISGSEIKIVLVIDSRVVVVVKTMKAVTIHFCLDETIYGFLLSNPSHIESLEQRRDCAHQTQDLTQRDINLLEIMNFVSTFGNSF